MEKEANRLPLSCTTWQYLREKAVFCLKKWQEQTRIDLGLNQPGQDLGPRVWISLGFGVGCVG